MPAQKLVKVLALDGGGIRGIIPALVLAKIEALTGRPACELFDLIAGTSTGGIIALGVTVPAVGEPAAQEPVAGERAAGEPVASGAKRPRWSALQLVEMYESEGPQIFHRSLLRKIETVDGLIEEKYSASGLETALAKYMGEAQLSEALTDVLVTSYDIQSHEPFFFKSFQPRPRARHSPRDRAVKTAVAASSPQPLPDYPMKVVGRATSAAPTYFEPEPVPGAPSSAGFVCVDGGTFANNPALCAYAEALRNNPGSEVLVVSLGTGRLTESISLAQAKRWGLLQWARPLLGVIMDGSSAAIDYQLDELLGADEGHYRFQTVLEGVSDSLDDVDPANIAGLRRLAEASIESNAARLAEVCERLTG